MKGLNIILPQVWNTELKIHQFDLGTWFFSIFRPVYSPEAHSLKIPSALQLYRVKSGMFGQTAKFGQRSCRFHTSIIGMKNKLTMKTVEILMRRLHLDFHCLQMCVRIYLMSEFTRLYPTNLHSHVRPRCKPTHPGLSPRVEPVTLNIKINHDYPL